MISAQDKLAAESFAPETGGAIALPVRAYQMSNSTLWNIRAADGKRLAVELNEMTAKEIEVALNERPATALFGALDEKQRADQFGLNCCWLLDKIDRIHRALCPSQCGTWQQRAEQAVSAAEQIAPPQPHKG